MEKIKKKINEINDTYKKLDHDKFLDEVNQIKNQTVKLLKEKLNKIEEFKENSILNYNKEFEKLNKKTNKAMKETNKEIDESFSRK